MDNAQDTRVRKDMKWGISRYQSNIIFDKIFHNLVEIWTEYFP
jgi:hypothetical protein